MIFQWWNFNNLDQKIYRSILYNRPFFDEKLWLRFSQNVCPLFFSPKLQIWYLTVLLKTGKYQICRNSLSISKNWDIWVRYRFKELMTWDFRIFAGIGLIPFLLRYFHFSGAIFVKILIFLSWRHESTTWHRQIAMWL